MKGRALVTGGAGFIGSHVADHYLREGYEVTVVDDLSSGRLENVPQAAEFVQTDIGSEEARALLAETTFDILNHHAAQMDVRVSVEDPAFDARTNILGLVNLLEGARAGGTRRVVFASSGGVVYGESDELPHPEEARKLPVSPYGVSKLTSEFYLAAYAMLYDMECVSLRYANVYGPRQNPHGEAGVVAIFCSKIKAGEQITIYGDGEQTRDYVNVLDVARANMAATRWPVPPVQTIDSVAFNIGTETETSVNELAQTLADATGLDLDTSHAAARSGELQRSCVAVGRAAQELDWKPQIQLKDGLRQTYEWISENTA
ncbi:MAG: GDP-mannose 4,6-dehydratase [Gemmatimonadota bacterium]|nr:MAG: GDP-mannose 4,6-dehydratase [Gemmatimonadota bacterium]